MGLKKVLLATVLMIPMVVLSAGAHAGSLKIGFFHMQKVIDGSKWGKQATAEFEQRSKKVKAEVDRKAKQFQALKEEYQKKAPMLDEKARVKKERELMEKQQEAQKAIAELNKFRNELTGPIVDKILEIAIKIGKDEKYDFVFEASQGAIIYAKNKYDLTKRIIKELDKVTPKK